MTPKWFTFGRFSDYFKHEDFPHDLVRFAVLAGPYDGDNTKLTYRMGTKHLHVAIQQAAAHITLRERVVIACADIREVTQ